MSLPAREVNVHVIRDLRHRILRAGLPPEAAVFDGDEEPTTHHFAVFNERNEVIGCATMLRRPWQDQPAWQIRGMAVADAYQGTKIGTTLLDAVENHARRDPFSLQLWCNARTPATGFYKRLGWQIASEEFEIPTAGPHFRMWKCLSPLPTGEG